MSIMAKMRLQKAIAEGGLASRRGAEKLILQGRVTVNGLLVTQLGSQVDPNSDEIHVDQKVLFSTQSKVYVLLYKPINCVTTLKDPQGRKTIMEFLPPMAERIYPVGRLDFDAEGLLILTNDGALAHRLQHPSYGVSKTYQVQVKGHPDARALHRLRQGILLEEGKTAPARVKLIRHFPDDALLEIVLHQGWKRQIKRMGRAVGHPVLGIKRIKYSFLGLGKLNPGQSRPLTPSEVRQLYEIVHLNDKKPTRHEKEAG
jgi:23S rRNA pseudouridine2605 synthase